MNRYCTMEVFNSKAFDCVEKIHCGRDGSSVGRVLSCPTCHRFCLGNAKEAEKYISKKEQPFSAFFKGEIRVQRNSNAFWSLPCRRYCIKEELGEVTASKLKSEASNVETLQPLQPTFLVLVPAG